MKKFHTHKRTTYFLPSWQGGDRELALCRRAAIGWMGNGGYAFRLADIGVTCPCCLGIMADGLRPNAPQKRHARTA